VTDAFFGEPKPCAACDRTDWIVSVIVDGRRLCGGCKRRLVSEPPPARAAEPEARNGGSKQRKIRAGGAA